MHQFKVQVILRNRGMMDTIISARNACQARDLAQAMYPDARIGGVFQID